MCSPSVLHTPVLNASRRSRRSIRPEEKQCRSQSKASRRGLIQELSQLTAATTESTSASSSSSSRRGSSQLRSSTNSASSANDARLQALQRKMKICPVTGVLRNISSDYHIFSTVLGKGHYGCVRECQHHRTRKIYACKSIEKAKIRRLDHVRREVYLLYKMKHHGVMKMVDCYEDAHCVHIITERYTGGELFDKITETTTPNGCFDEKKSAAIIKNLLEAVAYLHENDIVHRDIKPENILFESTRDDSPTRLIDFGLSRTHRDGEAPMSNPVGTAYYMAPELLEGAYDKSCDVWSIGTIAYIVLCGYPPFNGDSDPDIFDAIRKGKFQYPSKAWSDKSQAAKDFIECLLKMDPKERMTAREALEHPWIVKNTRRSRSGVKDDEVAKHEDLMSRIQSLRSSIQGLRKSVVVPRQA